MKEIAGFEQSVRWGWAFGRIAGAVKQGQVNGWVVGKSEPPPFDPVGRLAAGEAELAGQPTPMRVLAARMRLNRMEVDVLWMLACIELDPKLTKAASLLVAPGMNELGVQVAERLVCERPELELESGMWGRLAAMGLIEMNSDHRVTMARRAVRIADRVLELVKGQFGLDRELGGLAKLVVATTATVADGADRGAIVAAIGLPGAGRCTKLVERVTAAGKAAIVVKAGALACDAVGLARQLRIIARECRLHDAWPVVTDIDGIAERGATVVAELEQLDAPVFVTARELPMWPTERPIVELAIGIPSVEEREAMWTTALGDSAALGTAAMCAKRYRVPPSMLVKAATAARAKASGATGASATSSLVNAETVHEALRAQLDRKLTGLAKRVVITQTWDDLVMPVDQFDLLIELCSRSLHKHQVLETWGFAEKVGRGHGIAALFSGPPGTGKTMVAGLVASELGLDLYQVDLSKIISKYIGETEKQLAELFDAAESGHAILLFDEADSLFGKRTEVKSSNDRYANVVVNYLLQRLETFTGIAILTTNHETAIDEAFKRRLAMHVRVPMPEADEREELWRAMLPARAAVARNLDFATLANEFVMSGGYIKNAVVRAAFFAANDRQVITHAHLVRAARAEYESMGKLTFLRAA